jgi:tetratricopeptide (TPR) repeat protein
MTSSRVNPLFEFILAAIASTSALAQEPAPGPSQTELRRDFEEASARLEAWDIAGATAIADRIEKSGAGPVVIAELRGRIAFFTGDYATAAERLANSPSTYGKLAAATLAELEGYEEQTSEHFVIHYHKGKDALLAPYALETLEKAYHAIGKDLSFYPAERVRVEILRDPTALSRLSPLTVEEIRTSGTIALCKYNKLMVVSPRALATGYAWQDTLAHEYTHYLITRKSDNSVPIWLHEGIAKFEESRWRGPAGQALSPASSALLRRRLKEGKLITFEQMHPSIALLPSQEDAALAFAEVFTAIEYLVGRSDAQSLASLLDKLRDNVPDEEAIAQVAGEPFTRFQSSWRAYLKTRPMPAEMLPLVSERLHFKDQGPGGMCAGTECVGSTAKADKQKADAGSKEIDYGELAEIDDPPARRFAHLGQLLRERQHPHAAVIEFAKAESRVGARSPTLSNQYALSLLDEGQDVRAAEVLKASLRPYPEIAQTHLHLGLILLNQRQFAEARAELLAANAVDPFDRRIHAGLMRAEKELGDEASYQREVRAMGLLAGD